MLWTQKYILVISGIALRGQSREIKLLRYHSCRHWRKCSSDLGVKFFHSCYSCATIFSVFINNHQGCHGGLGPHRKNFNLCRKLIAKRYLKKQNICKQISTHLQQMKLALLNQGCAQDFQGGLEETQQIRGNFRQNWLPNA